jgi:hypothetical protein
VNKRILALCVGNHRFFVLRRKAQAGDPPSPPPPPLLPPPKHVGSVLWLDFG